MKQNLFFKQASAIGKRIAMVLTMLLIVGIGQAWGAEGDTHNFSQTLSQLLNNNASVASIEIAEQSYAIKTVKVTSDYNKSAGGVTMEVLVAGTSWGTATHNSDETKTFTFNGISTKGKVTIIFTNNCGSGTGKGTFKVTNVQLIEGAPATPYSVKFYKTSTNYEEEKETFAGAGVTPPSMELECGDWTFLGWSESYSDSETSTTELELVTLTGGKYYPTKDVNLYPVYTKTTSTGGTAFDKYTQVSLGGTITSGKYLISTGSYTMAGNGKTGASFSPGSTEKTEYEYTITIDGSYFTILGPDDNYVGGANSTTLQFGTTATTDSYLWNYDDAGIQNKSYTTRRIRANGTSDFRHYANTNGTTTYLYKRTEKSSGSTYYYSYPQCSNKPTVCLIQKTGIFTVCSFSLSSAYHRLIFGYRY